MNFERFISAISKARKPSPIREATALLLRSPPSMISLGGGAPNPETFPIKRLQVEMKDGKMFQLEGTDMSRALQYSESDGIPELKDWIKKLHLHYHKPPLLKESSLCGFDLCVTAGSQDGLAKVFEMLLSPGDNVLIEDPCYSGTLAFLKPLPVNLIPVETDEFGMKPRKLLELLSSWEQSDCLDPNSSIPKFIYTVPNGGNPTGATASNERKKEIYQIAQDYDLVIVEDDPYYFLQFSEEVAPSYQALDTDGRVIRSDSMSKVLSSGLRLGWISGASPFIERICLHQQATILHNSTLTQMLALKVLEGWGLGGFQEHVGHVKDFYRLQRDAIVSSATKWLTGLAEWNIPKGGMFLWMKIPKVNDSCKLILEHAVNHEILLIHGAAFSVDESRPTQYCRASFSLSSPERMDEGIKRLANLIKQENGY